MSAPILHALEYFTNLFHRPRRPRWCSLFIEVIALLIYIRKQPTTTAEQSALLRTLIGAAQRMMTANEWVDVLKEANGLLKSKPPVVGHWHDASDALNIRLEQIE
jgi:hypothetical protein